LLVSQEEILVHQVEQRRKRGDRGGDDIALDSRNRSLARACTRSQLRLRQGVTAPGIA